MLDSLERGHRDGGRPRGAVRPGRPARLRRVAARVSARASTACCISPRSRWSASPSSHPERYYRTNVAGTLNLLDAMRATGVPRLVFSSTCAVYGQPDEVPIRGDRPAAAAERLRRVQARGRQHDHRLLRAPTAWARSACATSTSPAPTGDAGEDHEPETHLIPNVAAHALSGRNRAGRDLRHRLPDARRHRDPRLHPHRRTSPAAHLLALDGARAGEHRIFNLGNGNGFSVREVIDAVATVTGAESRSSSADRRPGDPPRLVAASREDPRPSSAGSPRKPELDADGRRRLGVRPGTHPQGYSE